MAVELDPITLRPGQSVQILAPTAEHVANGINRARTRSRVTASGLYVEDPGPIVVPPTPELLVPVGYAADAAKAIAALNLRPLPVTHGGDAGPGSYRDAIANMSGRRITFDYDGPIRLLSTVSANSPRDSIIDARGKANVTFSGFGTDISGAQRVGVYNVASRDLVQVAFNSGLTFRNASTGVYVEGYSSDGYYHRALDLWKNTALGDVTIAWSILGHCGPGGYNYPLLTGEGGGHVSLYHVLMIDGDTRMPQAHYLDGQTAPDTTLDMANCISWSARPASVNAKGYYSGLTGHGGAKINVRRSIFYSKYNTTFNHAIHMQDGAQVYQYDNYARGGVDLASAGDVDTPFPVPDRARLPLDPDEATVQRQIIALAGRQPRDLVDAAYVAMLAAA